MFGAIRVSLAFAAVAFLTTEVVVAVNVKGQYCPPLGAVLPAPTAPSQSDAVQTAIKELQAGFKDVSSKFNYSALSVSIKSLHEDHPLFTQHYTPPTADARSTTSVDSKTVYRIGSSSKVFAILSVLKLRGVSLDDPVTKYLPQLESLKETTADLDPFQELNWEDVTLGALAAHISGVGVDFATDLTNFPLLWTKLGLPVVNASFSPDCAGLLGLAPCNASDFYKGFGNHPPVFAPYTTPAYSNIGYAILALVVEAVAKMPYEEFVKREILGPLNMTSTFPSVAPAAKNVGFIPAGDIWWGANIGFENPAGAFYSSTDDLQTFADAILSNKLLGPAKTRKWLKPLTSTSTTGMQLGAVWEIYRSDNLTSDGRLVEVYTKSGDIGNYHSMTVLVPDYDVTAVLLMGGNETSPILAEDLMSVVVTTLLPALEAAGKIEAQKSFAGTYADTSTNSTLKLVVDDGPGLFVADWTIRGVDVLANYVRYSPLGSGTAAGPITARLYPTKLQSKDTWSWRAVFDTETAAEKSEMDKSVFWARGSCLTWAMLDRITYQYKSLDEVVFKTCGGVAGSLVPRAFQVELLRS